HPSLLYAKCKPSDDIDTSDNVNPLEDIDFNPRSLRRDLSLLPPSTMAPSRRRTRSPQPTRSSTAPPSVAFPCSGMTSSKRTPW
ncbi:hypothetical protein VIGAN_01143800, partial [Vigna angularis var. angularis]